MDRAEDIDEVHETESARLNRELNELLQELRVAQGGILIIVGFLLVIPFTSRFVDVTQFQRIIYYLAFITAGASAITIIGPVSYHRLVFRRRDKQALIIRGHMMMMAGLGMLAVAVLFVLVLVTDFLFGTILSVVMGAVYSVLVVLLWYGLPLQSRRASARKAAPQRREAPHSP